MNSRTDLKQFATVFVATGLAVACLVELGVVEQVSYLMEKGRLRALHETLPSTERAAELTRAGRTVAELATPAVVRIDAEFAARIVEAPNRGNGGTADEVEAMDVGPPVPGDADPRASEADAGGDAALSVRQGIGSGFIFDAARGHILSNAHVIEGARRIRVCLPDGRETEGEVLGADDESDLAVLRIRLSRLHELPLGDSDAVAVGDDVFAIGSPYGLDGSVTKGIISAVNRRDIDVDGKTFGSLLQTDAVINAGSSGGPLVDLRGQVVGINSAVVAAEGEYDAVGFAIPTNRALTILPDLIDGGPAFLGVLAWSAKDPAGRADIQNLGWANAYGAVVDEVYPKTAAERAGLRPNDIIISLDGTRVDDLEKLGRVILQHRPGTSVTVELWRDRQTVKLPVRLGRRYAPR